MLSSKGCYRQTLMQPAITDIAIVLARFAPFDVLPEPALQHLAGQVTRERYQAGGAILNIDDPIAHLYLVHSGVVETFRRNGELYSRLGTGDLFGQAGLMLNGRVRFAVRAVEHSEIFLIPAQLFRDFCDQYDAFADYFESVDRTLLQKTLATAQDADHLSSVGVRELIKQPLITIDLQTSVQQAAQLMTEQQMSSILVVDPRHAPDESDYLVGMLTDWGLREKVLAAGLPPSTPACQVVTPIQVTIDSRAYLDEAIQKMLRGNLHHLPVMNRSGPLGVLALTDLAQHESHSSILLVKGLSACTDVEELSQLAAQGARVFQRLVKEDANSHMIGSAMSVIGRSIKQRLLELAQREFGEPPVKYCFLALGSMARDEQLLFTDQDNAIVLDDAFRNEEHGEYFERFTQYVSDGLNACGFPYCQGGIMATNPDWRLSRSQWRETFGRWIDRPDPRALLNSSIFFDLEGVAGQTEWATDLLRFVTSKTRGNRAFLASLARNALLRTPPLGFFKNFVVERDGRHKDSINLKRRGTAPLTDLIRVHALAIGSRSVNSFERIEDIIAANILPEEKGAELRDALEYISIIRIRNQAWQYEQDLEVDNNVQPEQLSTFERRNLKEAFQVVSRAQNFLKYRYNSNIPLKQ